MPRILPGDPLFGRSPGVGGRSRAVIDDVMSTFRNLATQLFGGDNVEDNLLDLVTRNVKTPISARFLEGIDIRINRRSTN